MPLPLAHLLPALALAAGSAAASPAPAPLPRAAQLRPGGGDASAEAIGHYLRARLAEGRGDLDAALSELDGALRGDPWSAPLRAAAAELLLATDRVGRAQAEARRALELDPDASTAVRARLVLGRAAATQGRWARACEELELAVRAEGGRAAAAKSRPDPLPFRELAEARRRSRDDAGAARALEELAAHVPAEAARGYTDLSAWAARSGELARADALLVRAAELSPGNADPWRRLGALREERRDAAGARAAWQRALQAEDDDVETLRALARLSAQAGDGTAARGYWRRLLDVDPDDDGARVGAVFALLDGGEAQEALAAIEEARGSSDPRVRLVRGLVLEELHRWSEAAAAFAALAADGSETDALARLREAHALSRAGRHDAAAALAGTAARRWPQDVRFATMQALVLGRAGRADEAAQLLRERIARLPPRAAEVWIDLHSALASALADAGRAGEAVETLRRALAERPGDRGLRFALGSALERAGRPDDAIAQMRLILAEDPDDAAALNFAGYTLADRGEALDEAERLLTRAAALRPRDGAILDSLGWMWLRRGEVARAVETLERAAALTVQDPIVLDHLGDAYAAAGRGLDATAAWRRAIRALDEDLSAAPPDLARGRAQRASLQEKLEAGAARAVR